MTEQELNECLTRAARRITGWCAVVNFVVYLLAYTVVFGIPMVLDWTGTANGIQMVCTIIFWVAGVAAGFKVANKVTPFVHDILHQRAIDYVKRKLREVDDD